MWSFFLCVAYLGLGCSQIAVEEKKYPSSTGWKWIIDSSNSCPKKQYLSLSKRRGLLEFVRETGGIHLITLKYFVLVGLTLAVKYYQVLDIGPKQSGLRNHCAKHFTDMQTCLGYREPARQKKKTKNWFILAETPDWHLPFWRPVVDRDTFSPLCIAPIQLRNWLCVSPSSAVHGGQYDTKYELPGMWYSSRYCKRHSWLTQFGAFRLPQPAVQYQICKCKDRFR